MNTPFSYLMTFGFISFIGYGIGYDVQNNNERKLYDNLMVNYNPDIRPRRESSQSVDVNIKLEMHKLQKFDEVDEVLHITGLIIANWVDEFLQWTPALYGGLDHIVIPAYRIWTPDLGLDNGVSSFTTSDWTIDFRVSIRYTGEVYWMFGGEFMTSCSMHVTSYPFDTQTCNLIWVSWLYGDNALTLTPSHNFIDLANYEENGEWKISSSTAKKLESVKITEHISYPRVEITLNLERKRTFYTLNIILPCLFLLILVCTMFWLPCDSGEKVSLGITIMLSFSVLQLMVADHIPHTSDYIPILSYILVIVSAITTFGVVSNIFVLILHHHGTYSRPSRIVRLIAFKYLAKFYCISSAMPAFDDNEGSIIKVLPIEDKENASEKTVVSNNYMAFLTEKAKEDEKTASIKAEWQALGVVLDHTCFIITCIFTIIAMMAILL